ncbi:MAG TPA: hypothetical protein VFL57_13750 [Bryobacteraceae bacterium]|nr:hypothetical protein [Bryobacteraceae bacterium]
MKRTVTLLTMAALAAISLYGGGFWLQLGNPEASAEARAAKAVVTILATGCHQPEKAEITGLAISTAGGKRQSIPLRITRLSRPGMFAVSQQWPAEGTWVLQFTGRNAGMTTGVILTAGPEGVDRAGAKFVKGEPTREDVEILLAKK